MPAAATDSNVKYQWNTKRTCISFITIECRRITTLVVCARARGAGRATARRGGGAPARAPPAARAAPPARGERTRALLHLPNKQNNLLQSQTARGESDKSGKK